MTKQPVSLWRQRARQVIHAELAKLPFSCDESTTRAVISAAYPFRLRENHPYKCWLAEVKLAMKQRFPKKNPPDDRPPVAMTLTSAGRLWLSVDCLWCNSEQKRCLVCCPTWNLAASIWDSPQWAAFQIAFREDNRRGDGEPIVDMARDWLLEKGVMLR